MASSLAATSSGVPKVATVLYIRRTAPSTCSSSGRAKVGPVATGAAPARSGQPAGEAALRPGTVGGGAVVAEFDGAHGVLLWFFELPSTLEITAEVGVPLWG